MSRITTVPCKSIFPFLLLCTQTAKAHVNVLPETALGTTLHCYICAAKPRVPSKTFLMLTSLNKSVNN